jgi:hypothetical protein
MDEEELGVDPTGALFAGNGFDVGDADLVGMVVVGTSAIGLGDEFGVLQEVERLA